MEKIIVKIIREIYLLTISSFTLLLIACSGSSTSSTVVSGIISDLSESTYKVTTDYALADGNSLNIITITLKDKGGNPALGYTPEISVSGDGVVVIPCTQSNKEGLSICQIKSTVPGAKTVTFVFNGIASDKLPQIPSFQITFIASNGPTNTPAAGSPTDTPAPGVPTNTPQLPTNTPVPGTPTNTPTVTPIPNGTTRSCALPANATAAVETYNSGSWGVCLATSCASNYHLNAGACDVDVISCVGGELTPINGFAGTRTWNGSTYDSCSATSCLAGNSLNISTPPFVCQQVGAGFWSANGDTIATACINKPTNAVTVTYAAGNTSALCTVLLITECDPGYEISGLNCNLLPTPTPTVTSTPTPTPTSTLTPTPTLPPPTISLLVPAQAGTYGGTPITISGSNFVTGASVKFGNNFATNVVVNSASEITCYTPAGSAAAVDVIVINPDAKSATSVNGFTYLASQTYHLYFDSTNSSNFFISVANSLTFSTGGPGTGNVQLKTTNNSVTQTGSDFNSGTHSGTTVSGSVLTMQ